MNHLVIGMGEVGTALAEVLGCPGIDTEPVSDLLQPDILHIAYPYSDSFTSATASYQAIHQPDLVVVHSTVPIGTCDERGWVHSPVRGRHPHLAESLRAFTKQFGGKRAWDAALTWPGEVSVCDVAADTEAAKLFELAQFGLQVRVTQSIYDYCEARGLDPEVVYRQSAEIYNTGYSKMGDDRFMRPILEHVPGAIGGHCVNQNMAHLDHEIGRLVREGLWA